MGAAGMITTETMLRGKLGRVSKPERTTRFQQLFCLLP